MWHASQFIAVAALLVFGWCVTWMGFGIQLFALSEPFGIVSILLSFWNKHLRNSPSKEFRPLPFSTLSEVLMVHRSVPGFRKRKYPQGMAPFRIRTPLEETALNLKMYASWLMFSPLVLLFKLFPIRKQLLALNYPQVKKQAKCTDEGKSFIGAFHDSV